MLLRIKNAEVRNHDSWVVAARKIHNVSQKYSVYTVLEAKCSEPKLTLSKISTTRTRNNIPEETLWVLIV